jgi:hypothetical protein
MIYLFVCFVSFFDTESCYLTQAGLKLLILMFQLQSTGTTSEQVSSGPATLFYFFKFILSTFAVLVIKSTAWHMLGNHSPIELDHPEI